MNTFDDLVRKNRSYRRFDESRPVSRDTLLELLELSRFAASGANIQALKYYPATADADRDRIFPCLSWAGYLKDWDGPADGERPTAYIVILGDTQLRSSFGFDPGIAAQTMLLGATERGYGGCMIGAIQRDRLRRSLSVPQRYEILMVVALGTPKETVIVEDMADGDNVEYYRDGDGVHHVPKRTLEHIIVDLGASG